MINWLNSNQGFVMCILTLVYVLATIVIVIYNKKSILEIRKTRDEESRPYIFVHLHKDPRDEHFYLRVKNYGKTGGIIDKISIEPSLQFIKDKHIEDFLKDVTLAPDQLLQFIILMNKEDIVKTNFEINISYYQTNNKVKFFSEKYLLIAEHFPIMGYVDYSKSNYTNQENALLNIANHLDSIRNKL